MDGHLSISAPYLDLGPLILLRYPPSTRHNQARSDSLLIPSHSELVFSFLSSPEILARWESQCLGYLRSGLGPEAPVAKNGSVCCELALGVAASG